MKINKSLDIDLNIISPQKHIRIHEGDIDSVDILIGVTVDDESVDLTGVTIKYDATINNYLAEQDADGSVVDDKISIPVTQNMTAMSGLLLIDVRMIQNDQILFTQTICATVEKAVVNGSTYIDFDKVTIIQRMNALEDKMDYIEELVENFDTSKLIVSTNRPPSGAPVEVDVDLLKVGDTWIQQGDEKIVYKLVEAAYHFRPYPTADPYHKFTWQPLNERHIISNTEPPETVTYQAIDYSVDGVAWSWYPVQDYFQSDHYAQRVTADEFTYYICEDSLLNSYNTGICDYFWREEGGSIDAYTKAETNALLADKMDLAPLNPTAEQIDAMPTGQVFIPNDSDIAVGVKTTAAGTAGDKQAPTKGYVDTELAKKMDLTPINPSSISLLPDGQMFYLDSSSEFKLGVKVSNNNNAFIPDYIYVRDNFRVISRTYSVEQVISQSSSFDMGSYYETTIYPYQKKKEMNTGDFIRNSTGDLWICAWKATSHAPLNYYVVYGIKLLARAGIDINDKENTSNKVTSLSAQSTDTQYPSAKCVYDMIGDVETLLSQV